METKQTSQKPLFFIIIFLLIILIIQSGILIHHLGKRNAPPTNAPIDFTNEEKPHPSRAQFYPQQNLLDSFIRNSRRNQNIQNGLDQTAPDYDPFSAMEEMQNHMNRLFNSALRHGPSIADSLSSFQNSLLGDFDFSPAIDIQETKDAYILRGDLPGLQKDKIDVVVKGDILTLKGIRESGRETKDDSNGYFTQERSYGSFMRTVTLPGHVDETKVKANYENGVLTITLPKLNEEPVDQKVPIQ